MSTDSWWSEYVLTWLPVGLAVASGVGYVYEAHRRRMAEKQLGEATRRGRAPYLFAESMYATGQGNTYDPVTGNVSTEFRGVAPGCTVSPDLPDGALLTLWIENQGEHVREVSAHGEHLTFNCDRAELRQGDHSAYVQYTYSKSRRGLDEPLRIGFCTLDGLKLHQLYAIIHGECRIKRIDPP